MRDVTLTQRGNALHRMILWASRWRSEAAAVLCALLSVFTVVCGTRSPNALALRNARGVDVERAMADVRELARAPRPAGSPANEAARLWLLKQLQPITSDVEVQEGTACDEFAGVTYCGHVKNVLARLHGSSPSSSFGLVAHYDSVFGGPGAADDAAGVATLLEVGRSLARRKHRNDIVLAFTDGEEDFLRGASVLVRHPWVKALRGAVNLEARGVSGPSALFYRGDDNNELLVPIGRSFNPSASSALVRLAQGLPNDSDATLLQRGGISTVAFAFADGLPHYHHDSDNAENLSAGSLAHQLDVATAFTLYFADVDERQASAEAQAPKVFFDVFGEWLVSYPAWVARVLACGLLAAVALGLWRRPLAAVWHSLAVDLLGLSVASALAAVSTELIVSAGQPSRQLSLVVVCASLVAQGLVSWRLHRDNVRDVKTAVVCLWAVPATLLGFLEPQFSYLFQWPLLALVLSDVLWMGAWGRRVCEALAAASAVVLWSWWAYTMLVAVGDAPLLGAIAACFGMTMLRVNLHSKGRRALVLLLAATGCLASVFVFAEKRVVVQNPEGTLTDLDSGTSRRVAWDPQVDPWALRFEERRVVHNADVPSGPSAVAETVITNPEVKRLRINIRSPRGASHLVLRELSGAATKVVSVDGEPVGDIIRFSPKADQWILRRLTHDRDSWRLQFAGLPAEGITVEVDVPAYATPVFELRDEASEGSPAAGEPAADAGNLAASFVQRIIRP